MVTRRGFLQSLAAAKRRPNVIVILADDQGYGDLGCQGSPHIRTPRIDAMAREGIRFTDFYAQPLCGPSRAALLTGCYPARNSLNFNHLPKARTGIHPNETTLAEMLKASGYATMMVGKWHLGDAPDFLPTRNGFDDWFGLPYSNDMWPYHPKVRRTGPENETSKAARERAESTGFDGQGLTYPPDWFPPLPLMRGEQVIETNPDQSTLTERYHAEALRFIELHRGRPFFLYLAHAMPHVPLYPGKAFQGRSLRGRYGDVIEEIDAGVGRILDKLKLLGVDQDTLVIYTSDNGPWAPYGIDAGSAGPLRGAKGSVWEGGIRVPAIFRYPRGIRPNQVTSEIAASIDILPTVAALTGAPPPSGIDGKDITRVLNGGKSPHERFYYFDTAILYKPEEGRPVSNSNLLAVREGSWKLHLKSGELFDLHGDIGESKNVAHKNPAVVESMQQKAEAFVANLRREVRPLGAL